MLENVAAYQIYFEQKNSHTNVSYQFATKDIDMEVHKAAALHVLLQLNSKVQEVKLNKTIDEEAGDYI
jgi:hypothetical protein